MRIQAPRRAGLAGFVTLITLVIGSSTASAEGPALIGVRTPVHVESPVVRNATPEPRIVYDHVIRVDGAPWLRLVFDQVNLGPNSYLHLTSLADGAVQDLDVAALSVWQNTSAFFNGDAVRVQLVAGANTLLNSVSVSEVYVGEAPAVTPRSQCGTTDDRVSSKHPAVARMLTASLTSGCTATIYSMGGCMVTAGHCIGQPVVQFNVPPSLPSGALQHPGPEDQYTVDDPTIIYSNGGLGNDWGVFQCLPNTQTGLTVYEAQESYLPFAEGLAPVGSEVTIYGYGTDTGVDNQTQQISVGPISSYSSTIIYHRADTEGGNSGSAILDENSEIIAVHTNAGCTSSGGANSGTNISNSGLAAAVAQAQLLLSLPGGAPAFVDPDTGATVQAQVAEGCEVADTVELFVRVDGGAYTNTSMVDMGGGLYEGQLPAAPCESSIDFYIVVTSTQGSVVTLPNAAPADTYHATVASSTTTLVSLDFETAVGWTVSGNATTGAWEVGVPVNNNRGDPPADSDGSGQCYLTANFAGDSDVDGGSTILTSPAYDLSGLNDPHVQYDRWYDNSFGAAPFADTFVVEVSNNNGASWVTLETVGPAGAEVSGGWFTARSRIVDFITPSSAMRFRFTASDLGDGSVVEAGLDAFEIFDAVCTETSCGDFDNDGDVDATDFGVFNQCFGGSANPPAPTCPQGVNADCDGDGDVDVLDFGLFAQNFTGSL